MTVSDTKNLNKTVLLIGLTLALMTGLIDVAIGTITTNSQFILFRSVLLPLSVTTGFFFVVFLALWFLAFSHLAKLLKLESIPCAIALGTFLATLIFLVSINYNSFNQTQSIPPGTLLTFIAVALLAMIVTYYTSKKIGSTKFGGQIGSTLSLLLPLILIETVLLIWLSKNSKITGYSLSIGFFLVMLLTIGAFTAVFKSKADTFIPLSVLALILLIVPPAAFVLTEKNYEPSANDFTESTHEINHVILITIDTLRTDVLSSYGSEEVETPNIDKLASDGTRFVNAYSSAPWTLPSFASIMTGLPPSVHRTVRGDLKMNDNLNTIAEYMRDSGYHTEAIVSNFFLHPEYNMDQGFLDYTWYPKRQIFINSFGTSLIKSVISRKFLEKITTSGITDLSIEWIEDNRDKDFFLWVHYYDPHIPYEPPLEYISQNAPSNSRIGNDLRSAGNIRGGHFVPTKEEKAWIKELYNAEVRYVDDNIGRLLEKMKELNMYNDSLIIMTSDHGEEFWDHGGFEHGHSLYNELIHVPLIIKAPGNAPRQIVETKVGTQSIMPTILDITGISYDNDSVTISSLVPLIENRPSEYVEQPLVSTSVLYYEDKIGVIFDDHKYIHSMSTNHDEIYNLNRDPREQTPLPLSANTDKINQANNILKGREQQTIELSRQHGITGSEKVKLDEEKKQKLKALDYIQ